MPEEIRLILTAPPSAAGAASAYGLPVGHMAYRVGTGAQLLRAAVPIHLRGGLMVIDSGGFDGRGDPNGFASRFCANAPPAALTGRSWTLRAALIPCCARS